MLTIIILISIGVLFIALDIILVPGMVLGIFGGLILIIGVIDAFLTGGLAAGTISLAIAFAAILLLVVYAVKADVWSRFALKSRSNFHVNQDNTGVLLPGQSGISRSALRPSGSAEFDGKYYEVTTYGHYCAPNIPVKITKIANGKVWVDACPESN